MEIMIEYGAVRTVLYGTISCQCPVTAETDQALFAALGAVPREHRQEDHRIPLKPFLEAAAKNPVKTPLQLFVEFASFSRDDPRQFTITRKDALRYFSCRYHFDRMLQGLRPLEVHHVPSFLVSHMMLPVTLADSASQPEGNSPAEGSEQPGATVLYRHDQDTVTFRSVFVPPSIKIAPGRFYGFHFGMVLTELSPEQAELVKLHLAQIPELDTLAKQLSLVDFSSFPGSANHFRQISRRWNLVEPRGTP
ncbi:hypothetical protein SAMN05920897_112102 [Alkalispirochaeta americana]|uniref:Uncharacterized protein n=1 Tax=Alkalispirochaeta americana TaxID=159291 RepID=A0A1N6UKX7_9SPIO|nr:hypothetical protein [Alkalispirochaeta americana]SIQ66308.1 hypothetical protein SAMN05920897_112102 [Alkalispirochaeta americana]